MSEESKNPEDGIFELIKWWEKKRVSFNLIVGITGIVALLIFGLPVLMELPLWTISRIIFYGIVLNGFYTLGWISEILIIVYFKKNRSIGKYKSLLFGLGTALSVFVTFFLSILVYPMMLIELH